MVLHNAQNLTKALQNVAQYRGFCYYSTEAYLVDEAAEKTLALLTQSMDTQVTRIEGPVPDIGEVIAAAGTLSMFGEKRVVYLPQIVPSQMREEDLKELCELPDTIENAILVVTIVLRDDKRGKLNKAEQRLSATLDAGGLVAELAKPTLQTAKAYAVQCAEALGARLAGTAALQLVEKCGTNYPLLSCEVAKLAALAGYQEITQEHVTALATLNIEADVFELARLVTSRRQAQALAKLNQLFDLQNEPIAVAAALAGSFVDMYRVKCGLLAKKNYTAVFKELGYKGSDYRLKKAGESASGYSKEQLSHCLSILLRLDMQLKGSRADAQALFQTALCEMMLVGART